eukprot:TRINITY_DN893_c0_g1_i1.p1 TRINITY_DN893_c0_g1~~TRINITY_DN893_c0_g1_i1.p1  ORF type:complete len:415 (+),score=113.25 TRINITY_DN893_c0_g1_i1:30-1247(+)
MTSEQKLTTEQEKAFKEFQEAVAKEDKKDAVEVASNDAALLRFLRARNFDLKAASEMRTKHLAWRKKYDVDTILQKKPGKVDLIHKLVPGRQHLTDKEGRPVLYEKIGKSAALAMQSFVTGDEYLRAHIYKQESLIATCEEMSKKLGKNIETFTYIIDLEGASVDLFKSTAFLSMCSENDKDNYPERLGRMLVINAPSFVTMFWKMVQALMDTKTKEKVMLCGTNYKEELLKIIPEENVPKEYGGKCECNGKNKACVPEFNISKLNISDLNSELKSIANTQVVVDAGNQWKKQYPIDKEGGMFNWFFRLDAYDIDFSVNFITADKKTQEIKKKTRLSGDTGSYKFETAGTVVLLFDNSYSYFRGKSLFFSAVAAPLDKYNTAAPATPSTDTKELTTSMSNLSVKS